MATFFRISDNIRGYQRYNYVHAPCGSQILYCEIEERVGMLESPCCDGIPYALDVDGWGELACIGEIYEGDGFTVEAVSYEEYHENMDY